VFIKISKAMDLFSCYTIRIRPNTDNPLLGTALSRIVKQRLASEAQAAVILTTRYSLIMYSRPETGIRGTGSSYTHVVGEAQRHRQQLYSRGGWSSGCGRVHEHSMYVFSKFLCPCRSHFSSNMFWSRFTICATASNDACPMFAAHRDKDIHKSLHQHRLRFLTVILYPTLS